MAQPNSELRSFIQRLIAATKRGRVEWITPTASNTLFEVDRPSGSLRVFSKDGDDNHPLIFQIFNPEHREIAEVETDVTPSDAWESEVDQLYELAKNQALGINDVMKSLEKELDLEEDIPS